MPKLQTQDLKNPLWNQTENELTEPVPVPGVMEKSVIINLFGPLATSMWATKKTLTTFHYNYWLVNKDPYNVFFHNP